MRLPEELLEKTKTIWGNLYERPISDEETLEITEHVIEFFRTLKNMKEKEEVRNAKTFSHNKTI